MDWWQGYWLLFPRSVLTLKCRSQLDSEVRDITDIIHTDTIIRTVILTTDRIVIMAIIGLTTGTAGTAITATIDITTTIGTKPS